MGGPEPKLMTVKEVADATGIPASTIRYYDQQFEEFLGIERGAGRRRLFSSQAVERLKQVQRLLKDEGLSVRQARKKLAGDDQEPAGGGGAELAALKARMAMLEEQLSDLRDIQRRTLALVDSLTKG